MKKCLMLFLTVAIMSCQSNNKNQKIQVFEEDWESLAKHDEAPEWFRDAKFGIYFHWGVYSVPAFFNEWYPRWMHYEDHEVYKHHVANYGHPSEFGYHNFVDSFKAEKFNAEEWAMLFKNAGARFAGPVAEHHDGFSMWDSEKTPWNAKDKGPLRDITGELKTAITQEGMKFITTFHHSRNLQRYKGQADEELKKEKSSHQFPNSHYPYFQGMPPTCDEQELKYMYGNISEKLWLEGVWFGKLKEVIDNYSPDIIWFDTWLDQIPEAYRQKFCAYYLNQAQKKQQNVVIIRKQDDLPLDVSVDDLEKSRKNEMGEKVWMSDETISKGSWCYTKNLAIKPAQEVLHTLIDIVSKNGVLLLNISPKADGSIPQEQRDILLKIGDWLETHANSIYGTRPWITYGEGPTKEPEGHYKYHKEFLKIKYTIKDIRYTTSKDKKAIFAFVLGVPEENQRIQLTSFALKDQDKSISVRNIKCLGRDDKIVWSQNEKGVIIHSPKFSDDQMAAVFEILLK